MVGQALRLRRRGKKVRVLYKDIRTYSRQAEELYEQAMRAGVPQVIVPFSHDQPDNADRVERLGLGVELRPSRLTGRRLARLLDRVVADRQLAARCREVAERFEGVDPLARACDHLEELGRTVGNQPHA
jgi:UDP:flavonoid glycosyltransferase YjiC (YdhE family)